MTKSDNATQFRHSSFSSSTSGSNQRKAQEGPVWQGPVGLAGLEIDYDDAWDS